MKDVLINNFSEACTPSTAVNKIAIKNKWCLIPYETGEHSGIMLSSFNEEPEDITINLNLKGFYKIYIALLMYDYNIINIKLSNDECFYKIATHGQGWGADEIEEAFWRVADMTENNIVISRKRIACNTNSNIAWIRLVPMTDKEVSDYHSYYSAAENKRLYATDDIHNKLFLERIQSIDDWKSCVLPYENSDVEWLAIENIKPLTSGGCSTGNIETSSFGRVEDKNVQEQVKLWYNDSALKTMIEIGHRMNIKMCSSLRAGAWGMGFPYTQSYFVNDFAEQNPDLRCVDRDGQVVDALSYAYYETQDYMISEFVKMAKLGFDAVSPIFHRGIPYVLFEKPIMDKFFEMYGEYPNELPLDDERLNALHCEIMTEYIKRLRKALDNAMGKDKVEIHVRVLFSVYDSKCVGLDVEEWARLGLINSIISYPQRLYERLDGDFWKDERHKRIDLKKYSDYFKTALHPMIRMTVDFKNFTEPYVNYAGKLCGPKSLEERIKEFMQLEKKYGTKVYFEIFPRIMPSEDYLECAKTLYGNGAERFSLWDTYNRVQQYSMWNVVRGIGHKDEINYIQADDINFSRRFKIISIAGKYENRYKTYFGG